MTRGVPKTDEQRTEVVPNFRPFLGKLEIPVAGICDDPCTVYRVNNEWRKYFISAMLVLDQPDIWDSTDADEVLAARRQVRELVGMSPCGCNELGLGAAFNVSVNTLIQLNYEQLFNAGGLDAVAPDRPDTTFDTDSGDTREEIYRRDLALCWAAHDYVNSAIEQGLFNAFISDISLIPATIAIAYFVNPLAGALFRWSIDVLGQLIDIIADNPEFISSVACCMYEGMQGQAITQANFDASLDNCGFTLLSDEWVVKEAIKTGFNDLGNYLSFVASLGGYFVAATALGDCPCNPVLCSCDFEPDPCDFTAWNAHAIWRAGIGWENSPGGAFNHEIHITFENDVDWNMGTVRVLLDNDDLGDVQAVSRIRAADLTILEQKVVLLSPGQQAVIFQHSIGIDFRVWELLVETTDFPDNNINCIIKGIEVISGDCVFPA